MNIADRLIALMESFSADQVDALPPVDRQLLAAQCRRLLAVADPAPRVPAGILTELKNAGSRT